MIIFIYNVFYVLFLKQNYQEEASIKKRHKMYKNALILLCIRTLLRTKTLQKCQIV